MSVPAVTEGMTYAIEGHASRLNRRFPMCSRDDIKQEMYLWWYSHPRIVRRYLEDAEDEKVGQKKLSASLRNAALAWCHQEKARAIGYEVDDLYFYSVGLLRELLVGVYDMDAWIRMGRTASDGLPRGKSDPAEGNNALAALSDVSRAVEKLTAGQRDLIELTFRDGLDEDQLGVRLGVSADAARMRVQRVLFRLQDELGGDRPDWAEAQR